LKIFLVESYIMYSEILEFDPATQEYTTNMICIDRIEKTPDGSIELAMTIDKMNHDSLKRKGFYRKFLENPDNIWIG